MKLEDIGFYTLTDERADTATHKTALSRCELILTSRCNFKCPYCRGMLPEDQGDMTKERAFQIVSMWASHGLKNIRFSGGEPTLWPYLNSLVEHAKSLNIKRIALSTNGSASADKYLSLIHSGVNDFSISLDSCCASTGNRMAGRSDVWDTIISNIKRVSQYAYTTVGVVLTQDNYKEVNDIVKFASGLGVRDIRVIPAAQVGKDLKSLCVDGDVLEKNPILKYRHHNFVNGRGVRGLSATDNKQCPLVLDDMVIMNEKHYPCIIYMREQGGHIGFVGDSMDDIREKRRAWFESHDCNTDQICSQNCLDVCVDYNNKHHLHNRLPTNPRVTGEKRPSKMG